MKKIPVVAHLDLKGIQYRHEYYGEYFRNLRELGYDAVLVEYEDVFPFVSARVSSQQGEIWPTEFLREFLNLAARESIEIIPLQQCLGHLEYAFRIPENRPFSIPEGELRDLHIALPEARKWLRSLLEEMLGAHPGSRFIHLGMDEAGGFAQYAEASGQEPLAMFLDYLEELCEICKAHDKTPLIWSDMLEDYLSEENLERILSFRDKLILVPWNYAAGIKPESIVRFSGFRCGRPWLENPQTGPENASPLWDGLGHFEDWEPKLQNLTEDFRESPYLMDPLFQAAVWKRLGFTVWGGAGGSITQDRSVLPYYNWRASNIRLWKETVDRYQLDGLIITQWARSNSCTVPNIIPDVVWPILARAASSKDSASAFFPEVKPEVLDALIFKIGKCREDWCLENSLIQEMTALPISKHAYEWQTMLWMLQVWLIHKEIEFRKEQVGCYVGIGRLNEVAWKKHENHIIDLKTRLLKIREEVRVHLEKRYFGSALEEWFYKVFTIPSHVIEQLESDVKDSLHSYQERQQGKDFRAS